MAKQKNNTGGNLGFEAKPWAAACKLPANMDAAEYKHVALGLIFSKQISDAFLEDFKALRSDRHADRGDDEWQAADCGFRKRQDVAHKMGVVDQECPNKTNNPDVTVVRKVVITEVEVRSTVAVVRKIVRSFAKELAAIDSEDMPQ